MPIVKTTSKKTTSNYTPIKYYSGPVPEGYNEDLFRLTGVTKRTPVSGGGGGSKPKPTPSPEPKLTTGESKAIEKVKTGGELTRVDVFNLQKGAEKFGYGTYFGGKTAGLTDVTKFAGSYINDPVSDEQKEKNLMIQSAQPTYVTGNLMFVPEKSNVDLLQLGTGEGTYTETRTIPPSILEASPKATGLEKIRQNISLKERELFTAKSRGKDISLIQTGLTFGAGFAKPFIETAIFAKTAITQPLTIPAGIVKAGKGIISGEIGKSIGTTIKESPEFFAGSILGEVALFKGTQYATRGVGIAGEYATAKLSPKFKAVKTIGTGEKFISSVDDLGDIGLIPAGKGLGKTGEATIRGGFGFTKAEQKALIGREGVVTSQRSLTPRFSKTAPLKEMEKGFGLFGTPAQESGVLQTRVSRLGELPKPARFRDILSGEFTLTKPRPEVIVFPKERVGTKGRFETLGYPSSELETATLAPRLGGAKAIKIVKTQGVTFIGYRKVPIKIGEFILDTGKAKKSLISKKPSLTSISSDVSSDLVSTRYLSSSSLFIPAISIFPKKTKVLSGISKYNINPLYSTFKKEYKPKRTKITSPLSKISFDYGDYKSQFKSIPRGSVSPILPKALFTPPTKTISIPINILPIGIPQKPKKRKKPKRSYKRIPSIVSAEFGIYSPKPLKGEITGLGLRPLISYSSKRRKKAKGFFL